MHGNNPILPNVGSPFTRNSLNSNLNSLTGSRRAAHGKPFDLTAANLAKEFKLMQLFNSPNQKMALAREKLSPISTFQKRMLSQEDQIQWSQ